MQTKPLLYGLIGFFVGGLLVAVATTTFNKPETATRTELASMMSGMSMDDMTMNLQAKKGDEFDRAFIESMIAHHQGAVDMAKLSADQAKHMEIKQLSTEIIAAQEKEISAMKQWYKDWGYGDASQNTHMNH